jgi:hypothetical protein
MSDIDTLQEYLIHLHDRRLSRAGCNIQRFLHGLMNYRVFLLSSGKRSGLLIPGTSSQRTQTQEQTDRNLTE